MASRVRQTWWRRERLAIVLLPLVLVAVLAATGSRVHDYWWIKDFRDQAPISAGGVARIDVTYDDGYVTYPIRANVRLVSAAPVTELPDAFAPISVPTGSRLWQVELGWRADPDSPLTGCNVALVDGDGNRYDDSVKTYDAGAPTSVQTCVPDDTPGPKPVFGKADKPAVAPGEQPRPSTYTTKAFVVVPSDVEPTAVRLWWILPDYAELPVG